MWTKSINIEVILICFLSLIPWPGPSVFKISCSRESARVVRKIVQSKWLPILEKYQVKIPLECPFHPLRDIFGPQQAAKKQNRPSQWTCGFCGKSFYEEKHLDMHFENRHKTHINAAEDAICLANYCDIMRCKVLVARDSTLSFGDSMASTDIEIWSEATAYRTALTTSGPRDLAKLPARKIFLPSLLRLQSSQIDDTSQLNTQSDPEKPHCDNIDAVENDDSSHGAANKILEESPESTGASDTTEDDDSDENDSNATKSCDGNLVDSALPPTDRKQQRLSELQKLKDNCKSEDLEKLKTKCELLVRDCIAGLLIQLSDTDFKSMEDELNRAVCWYLTCDRYWEDGPVEQRPFPWGLMFVLVMVLSLGVCFCYYIIWILFDSDDHGMPPSSAILGHASPTHQLLHHQHHQHLNAVTAINYPPTAHSHALHTGTGIGGTGTGTGTGGIGVSTSLTTAAAAAQSAHQLQPTVPTTSTIGYPEDIYGVQDFNELGQSEHYIYVTYPPELKRRLLESCYNRTTRL